MPVLPPLWLGVPQHASKDEGDDWTCIAVECRDEVQQQRMIWRFTLKLGSYALARAGRSYPLGFELRSWRSESRTTSRSAWNKVEDSFPVSRSYPRPEERDMAKAHANMPLPPAVLALAARIARARLDEALTHGVTQLAEQFYSPHWE